MDSCVKYKFERETDKVYRQGTGKLIILINPCSFPATTILYIIELFMYLCPQNAILVNI